MIDGIGCFEINDTVSLIGVGKDCFIICGIMLLTGL